MPRDVGIAGVLKRHSLRLYQSKGGPLYPLRGILVSGFVWWTKVIYARIARQVVRDVGDYQRAGIETVGVVGIVARRRR